MTSQHRTGTPLSSAKTRIWRCGDQTRCPTIPEPEGNPWDICLEPLMKKDHQKCEAWRDEIQNLLIFSGLFSAVVTAFVVQTYEGLQPSPQDYIPTLLAHLIQLQNNHTEWPLETFSAIDPGLPSASAIRTHICWFSSLILSLIVVLVGTVSLQWLREYQRYRPSLSSKKLFAARSLRAESFERWYAPQIIASLPLLLQLAVFLFFIGLMDTLLQINRVVAIPVIILGGLAMCFQALTTVLPTFQSFWLISVSGILEPPLQCPYKSPQSWVFLRFMTSTVVRFFIKWIGSTIMFLSFIPFPGVSMIASMLGVHSLLWKFIDNITVKLHLRYFGTVSNWDEFDDLWLKERHRLGTESSQPSHNVLRKGTKGTDYDAARGIANLMSSPDLEASFITAIYHCFQGLDISIITDELLHLMAPVPPSELFAREGLRKGQHLISPSTSMIKEENEMFLLSRLPRTSDHNSPLHMFHFRQLELFVRTTAHIFTNTPTDSNANSTFMRRRSLPICLQVEMRPNTGPLFVPPLLKDAKAMQSIPHDFAIEIAGQLVFIFETYITSILNAEGAELQVYHSIAGTEPVLAGFMDVVHVASVFLVQNSNSTATTENMLITDLTVILDQITARLSYTLARPLPDARLLRCAKLYASRFHPSDWDPIKRRAPIFGRSFQALVHIVTLHILEHPDYTSSYLPYQLAAQWEELCKEVLQTPASQVRSGYTASLGRRVDPSLGGDVDIVESTYPSMCFPTYATHSLRLTPNTNSKSTVRTVLPECESVEQNTSRTTSGLANTSIGSTSSTLCHSPQFLDNTLHCSQPSVDSESGRRSSEDSFA